MLLVFDGDLDKCRRVANALAHVYACEGIPVCPMIAPGSWDLDQLVKFAEDRTCVTLVVGFAKNVRRIWKTNKGQVFPKPDMSVFIDNDEMPQDEADLLKYAISRTTDLSVGFESDDTIFSIIASILAPMVEVDNDD